MNKGNIVQIIGPVVDVEFIWFADVFCYTKNMNDNDELIKKANLQEIVDKGEKIYEQIKSQYEPQHNGKFLAIEVESKKVYFGNESVDAVMLAKKEHPDTVFYVVKIGYGVTETLAKYRPKK